eukprot:9074149-Lingulodinium_polyedra.AAC.1
MGSSRVDSLDSELLKRAPEQVLTAALSVRHDTAALRRWQAGQRSAEETQAWADLRARRLAGLPRRTERARVSRLVRQRRVRACR